MRKLPGQKQGLAVLRRDRALSITCNPADVFRAREYLNDFLH